jgi:hypothetical protein
MHVSDFLFIFSSEFTWGLFHLDVDGSQQLVVLLKVSMHFIEESHTSDHSFYTVFVSFNGVFLRSIDAINQK